MEMRPLQLGYEMVYLDLSRHNKFARFNYNTSIISIFKSFFRLKKIFLGINLKNEIFRLCIYEISICVFLIKRVHSLYFQKEKFYNHILL